MKTNGFLVLVNCKNKNHHYICIFSYKIVRLNSGDKEREIRINTRSFKLKILGY